MIVDASVIIDAVADPGPRGIAARGVLAAQPAAEPLIAPGHFAVEVMSGLNAAANRPSHPFQAADLTEALKDAESFGILSEATPWADVHRAWTLASGSLRHADALYVAAAERRATALLTADARIERSGAPTSCEIITVVPGQGGHPSHGASTHRPTGVDRDHAAVPGSVFRISST